MLTDPRTRLSLLVLAAGKLDYIQGMGFDAVWISPVVDNLAGETPTGEAYHGSVPALLAATRALFARCSY